MTGFSYYRSPFARIAGLGGPGVFGASLVASLLALAGAVLLVVGAGAAEHARLAALDAENAAMAGRLAVVRRDDARAAGLVASITALRSLLAAIDDAHTATVRATNAIVRLGNALPEATWLTSVRGDRDGAWTFGGRATHLAAIGTTLRAAAGLDAGAGATLVSVTATGPHAAVLDFTIALEPAR